ncbi:CpaF family protein [Gordoniibacillus kamchatkensis]|uniref:CpaF family protein n=1 Tax=Gordoniibacillus kamchatkensis TaxID=1590651 RepID=UPI0012E03AB5|nr:CpaF family protein [Paenibacillus sp. VKM B-2647]
MDESVLTELKRRVHERLDYGGSMSDDQLRDCIEDTVLDEARRRAWTVRQRRDAVYRLFHSFRGLDALQPLLDDPSVTEIMVNDYEEVFIERAGTVQKADVRFESRERLEDIIQAIVGKVNRTVNESSPIVDARLPDGSRVHVVLPPVALKGPTLTIRRFPERPFTMDDLLARGSVSSAAADALQQLVKAKYNIFVSGGTGSGKTTMLNALAGFIPAEERIVSIEDSAELQLHAIPNWVALETRNANAEGKGEISIRELIRASLRMRPSRIIVGEVRGGEALDMLQAMNTGHEGSLSTGHSNTSRDMLSRLETMILSVAPLPTEVIRRQIAAALDILVHVSRLRDGRRTVTEIHEVAGMKDSEIELRPLYRFVETGERSGVVQGELEPTGLPLLHTDKLTAAGMPVPASLSGGEARGVAS